MKRAIDRWELSRRELLARLGVGLGCLPLLHATRAYAQPVQFPQRLLCVLQPFGYRQAAWLPPVGPLGKLPPSAAALEPHAADLIFLGGLTNPAIAGCDACARAPYASVFSGAPTTVLAGDPQPSTATFDQVIALALGVQGSPLRSLALGVMVDAHAADVPLGGRRSFWRGPGQPVAPESDPARAAGRVLGVSPRLLLQRKSILDYVGRQLERFGARLGTPDRMAVQQHLGSLRDVETLLGTQSSAAPACPTFEVGTPPDPVAGANFPLLVQLQLRLAVMALRCGLTRVVTVQLGDAHGSGVPFAFLGANGPDWESIATAPPKGAGDAKLAVDKWMMQALGNLLAEMKSVPEADATLLDHASVLWASPVEDGASRDAQKLPWILAGKCYGFFKTGQSAPSAGQPLNGVLAQLCAAMGAYVPYFGSPEYGAPLAALRP